ncbi:MAG: phage portal protein [Flavobacteriaceae bacterium]|nr:phage portal protein [Flavobacteriaceae bacterium]
MFERIRNFFTRAATVAYTGGNWVSLQTAYLRGGKHVDATTALSVSTVYACIYKIASTLGTLELTTLRKEGTGSKPAIELGIYNLLKQQPDEGVTASFFFEQLVANMLLHGKGYALIVRNVNTGLPERLEFIPSKAVEQLDYDGVPVFKVEGLEGVVFNDDILCIPYLLGASPIELHADTIRLAKAAESYASEYFNNGSIMTGVLSSDQPLKKEQLDIVRDSWNSSAAGNLTRVLPAGFKYERIALSPDEAQNIESRKLSAEDIARIFNIPPSLIGLEGHMTYNNTEQAGIFFAKHTILPIARRIEQEIENKLLTPEQRVNYFVRFNIDDLMRGDLKTRAEYYNTLLQAGCLTANEVRAFENLPTVEGGDALRIPVNVISASKFEAYSEKISTNGLQ